MKRCVILTPFAEKEIVAAVLAMRGVAAYVIPSDAGVLVALDEATKEFHDWDISELLGESEEEEKEPTPAEYAAGALSALTDYGVVVMEATLADDVGSEPGVSGIVKAHRVRSGERGEDLHAGQLINALPDEIEDLLIVEDLTSLPGAMNTSDLSPQDLQAMVNKLGRTDS
ncbi:hypothetical protein ACFPGO_03785 [Arcanobacterium canis]|uniref:Uncharacterized protein n=1 Tax=Arcanobacterium canis TaxID=999183 RepID=A0ABY8G225_9ACTO|nr:hypothetical protein [Arcanobacterium canis]WFM84076.1 hypothetical protein P7079_03625 [Arcanobacterium canis]